MTRPKISQTQIILLMIGSALMFSYVTMPIIKISSGTNIIILIFLSLAYLVILDAPLIYFANKNRNRSFLETTENICAIIKVALFLYLITLAYSIFVFNSIVIQFMKASITPGIPEWGITLAVLIAAFANSYKGVGVLARVSVIFVLILLFSILLFALFSIPDLDISRLLPVYEKSNFMELNKCAILIATISTEATILVFFGGCINEKLSIKRTYITSITIYLICLIIIVLPTIMILGNKYAPMLLNPYYTFARQIKLYDSLERFHILSILAGFPCIIMRIGTKSLIGKEIIDTIFKKKTRNGIVILVFILVIMISMNMFKNFKIVLLNLNFYANIMLIGHILLIIICFGIWIAKKKSCNDKRYGTGGS